MIKVSIWHNNLSPFKMHDFRLSSRQADSMFFLDKAICETRNAM